MRIISLTAENFKRLVAVEITPEGHVVEVKGKNGSGKSSVLDAIYVALVGRSAAPPRPIRNGEEKCLIKLDLGDLAVTRTFTVRDGGSYTDTLKVESAEGLRYPQPQQVLDALLGEIGFDPFEFCQMKPAQQADTLLRMVPLPVDLDELAELDASDYAKRRDVNRDLAAEKARLAAIAVEQVPEALPDRSALIEALGNAAQTNGKIETARAARAAQDRENLANEAECRQLEDRLKELQARQAELYHEIKTRDPLPEPVDTEVLSQQIREADAVLATVQRQSMRDELKAAVAKLEGDSQALTDAMHAREKARQEALAGADMPIEGLGFAVDDKGRPTVTFGGVPFEQASTAEQLRASTAIAMAANPQLRVLRVKDGSLLDEDSMKLLGELAAAEDFQLFVERVGTGGVGVIMEDGMVKCAPEPKKTKPKAADKPEGALV